MSVPTETVNNNTNTEYIDEVGSQFQNQCCFTTGVGQTALKLI